MDPVYRTVIAISLVITAAAAAIALYRLYRSTMDEEKAMREKDSAYTTADYRADLRCEICFDDIGDEPVSQCGKCGKTFHLSCAEPTGECPYCGTRFEDFLPPRPPRHVTCPRCGNPGLPAKEAASGRERIKSGSAASAISRCSGEVSPWFSIGKRPWSFLLSWWIGEAPAAARRK